MHQHMCGAEGLLQEHLPLPPVAGALLRAHHIEVCSQHMGEGQEEVVQGVRKLLARGDSEKRCGCQLTGLAKIEITKKKWFV